MHLSQDPSRAEAERRVGSLVGDKWHLDKLLGIGGMACVYAATHRNGHRVAIKMLHRILSVDSQIRERFLREGYVGNKVDHPGAVTVFDDNISEDGAVFLVMELLRGETLDARASRSDGRLEADEALAAAYQLLDVLSAAHAKGIVHRDIKPENSFVTLDGLVRVLDFGIARLREPAPSATKTHARVLMGTPGFMAPEQAQGLWDEVNAQTDLWAVGATLFTLLTGQLVHATPTAQQLLVAAMVQPARSLESTALGLPANVVRLVDRALAFHKRDRWADAKSMQTAVRSAYEALTNKSIDTGPARLAAGCRSTVDVDATAPTVSSAGAQSALSTTARPLAGTELGLGWNRRARLGLALGAALAVIGIGSLVLRAKFGSGNDGAISPARDAAGRDQASSAAQARAPRDAQAATAPDDATAADGGPAAAALRG